MTDSFPGIALNEDDSHFFFTRAGQPLTPELVDAWVDQYAGTQVKELLLCPNAMRTSYASRVWDPIWRGYDPAGPDDQPLLASTTPEARAGARAWIHTAWQLHALGIDPYARWIARARQAGLSPWISTRMNDIHNVDDERSYIHSEFWREHPEFRRVPWRFTAWQDRALDFARPEVRAHHLALIEELCERYDFDGLELDWMRFGYHLRPGFEEQGAPLLTEFTAAVRRLLDAWQVRRGHRIRLGARVPSRPATSLGLGMDAAAWAKRGLLDMLVVTPFWATAEGDMPLALWRSLLAGTGTLLAAGLEVLLRPHPRAEGQPNSLETARGLAAGLLWRGADRVYLFNYMDSQTCMADLEHYPALLRELGSLETLAGKPRRHVLTYADTWAPGEAQAAALPAAIPAGGWHAFRLPLGPAPRGAVEVRLAAEDGSTLIDGALAVRVNGEVCAYRGAVTTSPPCPPAPLAAWTCPSGAAHAGDNVIDLYAERALSIGWVEIAVQA